MALLGADVQDLATHLATADPDNPVRERLRDAYLELYLEGLIHPDGIDRTADPVRALFARVADMLSNDKRSWTIVERHLSERLSQVTGQEAEQVAGQVEGVRATIGMLDTEARQVTQQSRQAVDAAREADQGARVRAVEHEAEKRRAAARAAGAVVQPAAAAAEPTRETGHRSPSRAC